MGGWPRTSIGRPSTCHEPRTTPPHRRGLGAPGLDFQTGETSNPSSPTLNSPQMPCAPSIRSFIANGWPRTSIGHPSTCHEPRTTPPHRRGLGAPGLDFQTGETSNPSSPTLNSPQMPCAPSIRSFIANGWVATNLNRPPVNPPPTRATSAPPQVAGVVRFPLLSRQGNLHRFHQRQIPRRRTHPDFVLSRRHFPRVLIYIED